MYGVVACPHCRRVQIVEWRHACPTCRRCAKPLELARLRSFYRGEDPHAARVVLTRVSAQVEGMGIEEYAKLLAHLEEDPPGTVDQVLDVLAARADFDSGEFAEEMRRLRVAGDASRVLAALHAENRVYVPREGRFRVV